MVTSQLDDLGGAVAGTGDLGPLAWVLEETRRSIETSTRSVRRFAREAEAARGVDMASLDAGPLRMARQQLHQVMGALDMVGQSVAALMVRAMEGAVHQFIQHPDHCSEQAAVAMERAGFALLEYLEGQLGDRPRSPIGLFPQYRQVQELAGAERIHPVDLWPQPWRWFDPATPASAQRLSYGPEVRARLDHCVLKFMRDADINAAAELGVVSLGLAAGASGRQPVVFWKLAAGFFEAAAKTLVQEDLYVKRAASRVLLQYAALAQGEQSVPERLALELLFFCAQAQPRAGVSAPALAAVRAAWNLDSYQPVDYNEPAFGLFDPAVLAQARRRIESIKENWSALTGGDMTRKRSTVDQFGLVAESLIKLHPESRALADMFTQVAAQTAQSAQPPSPELAMETATAVLFLEAAFADFQPGDGTFGARIAQLAERLKAVLAGGAQQPLDPWMEELYGRVSDRQTMGTVVSELRVTLGDVEQRLDQYFRHPEDKTPLAAVPSLLAQMRGVLSVLGLDQAASAVGRMRETVEGFAASEQEEQALKTSGGFDRLGTSLGALGFLVDMLGYQPVLAKKLFAYDEETGELRPLMGRTAPEPGVITPAAPAGLDLEFPAHEEPPPPPPPAAPATDFAPTRPTGPAPIATAPAPITAPAAPPQAEAGGDLDADGDLRDIFLEEAGEVIGQGLAAVQALTDKPGDLEQQTALRRAFHTLKGSSRMVKLTEFGEAAWSLEQVLNAWLPEQKPVTPQLLALAKSALTAFGEWVQDIAGHADAHWRAAPFTVSADAWRKSGQVVPLAAGSAATAVPVAEPAPAPAPEPGVFDLDMAEPDAEAPPSAAPLDLTALDLTALVNLPDLNLPAAQEPAGEAADAEKGDESAMPDFAASIDVLESDAGTESEDKLLSDFNDLQAQSEAAALAEGVVAQELDADALDGDSLLDFDLTPPPPPPEVPAPPEAQASAPVPLPPDDASLYKQIGDLKIGIPLYNVYLSEADGWSRELTADLSEWALMLGEPVPERAMARAHGLAGSSATVGFDGLSNLARAVEHALQRLHVQPRGTAAQAATLVQAAQEISRLLHQFAAGILKEPNPDVVQAVRQLEPTSIGVATESSQKAPLAPAAGPGAARQTLLTDEIGVADAVDEDLFPIFEDEAEELLPQIAGALRAWIGAPEDRAARDHLMRGLHTLKGSARLAGALRLGEMAHRTESAIGLLGNEGLQREDIEPLLDNIDEMRAVFRQLQARGTPEAQEAMRPAPSAPAPFAASVPAFLTPSAPAPVAPPVERGPVAQPAGLSLVASRAHAQQAVRVRTQLLDRLVNQVGEVITSRARLESEVTQLRTSLTDLTGNLDRLRTQLRDVELQAETQMQSRLAQTKDAERSFDPLEFDRFTRMQELTRIMAESVNDVATVQRTLQRAVEASESDLAAQARQSRELQRDLLRTRMVEFDSIAERLYRVVRQSAKEAGKQVRLDISGGAIEMDRGILERMVPAFEHLLRNCVVHGIEPQDVRAARGKDAVGLVTIEVTQSGNDVSVLFRDDGGGLDAERIRERAISKGLVTPDQELSEQEIADLIFAPGLTTMTEVTELAGRGVGMDVVHTEIQALGGRVEISSRAGQGTSFLLLMPLTTAVTHVVMLRAGELVIGVPSNLVENVRRVSLDELKQTYRAERFEQNGESVSFYWAGALLQNSAHSVEPPARTATIVVFRSADRRVALHVDEVLGQQEVVVKSLGPQLARLPGLAAITALASGAVALIYNPVALANVYGRQARAFAARLETAAALPQDGARAPAAPLAQAPRADIPLVLVVDDSITVRRVTQRLLQREGYRVALANDGLQGLERLQAERPSVVLTDIEMPRMDGFDFVRAIRADQALHDLPVIMITSRIAEKHREHAQQLGVNDYLGKPYPEEELLALVKRYARESALKQG